MNNWEALRFLVILIFYNWLLITHLNTSIQFMKHLLVYITTFSNIKNLLSIRAYEVNYRAISNCIQFIFSSNLFISFSIIYTFLYLSFHYWINFTNTLSQGFSLSLSHTPNSWLKTFSRITCWIWDLGW